MWSRCRPGPERLERKRAGYWSRETIEDRLETGRRRIRLRSLFVLILATMDEGQKRRGGIIGAAGLCPETEAADAFGPDVGVRVPTGRRRCAGVYRGVCAGRARG